MSFTVQIIPAFTAVARSLDIETSTYSNSRSSSPRSAATSAPTFRACLELTCNLWEGHELRLPIGMTESLAKAMTEESRRLLPTILPQCNVLLTVCMPYLDPRVYNRIPEYLSVTNELLSRIWLEGKMTNA